MCVGVYLCYVLMQPNYDVESEIKNIRTINTLKDTIKTFNILIKWDYLLRLSLRGEVFHSHEVFFISYIETDYVKLWLPAYK